MSLPESFRGRIFIVCIILLMVSCASAEDAIGYPPPVNTGPIEELETMVVTVQVTPDVARVLQNQSEPIPASKELIIVLEELDITLEPIHPGTRDPLLIIFFTVDVADSDSAEVVINRLLESEAVEAAYLKPPAEPAGNP
jgi:hypothetical protein